MDPCRSANQVHTLFGAIPRPKRDNMRACLLLDLHSRLGQRKARMSAVQAGRSAAKDSALEKLRR